MTVVTISILCGFIAVLYGFITSRQVLSAPAGNEKMQDIAAAIQEGAQAYLNRQYRAIGIVGVVVAVLVFVFLDMSRGGVPISTIGFLLGSILSGVAGYVGMNISVRANVRTAQGASDSLQTGLTVAFRAGAVTGMLVAHRPHAVHGDRAGVRCIPLHVPAAHSLPPKKHCSWRLCR